MSGFRPQSGESRKPPLLRIAICGGSSAGKSTLLARILKDHGDSVVGVAEIASGLLSEWPSYDPRDIEQRRSFQTEIFRRQVAQEQEADAKALAEGRPIVMTDRGSIDGGAYWPDGPEAFWTAMGTSHLLELCRYDVVFFLQSSARIGAYNPKSNAVRWDDAREALALEDRILGLWSSHPRIHIVPPQPDYSRKCDLVLELFREYLVIAQDGLEPGAAP